jgi:hypothetical protein
VQKVVGTQGTSFPTCISPLSDFRKVWFSLQRNYSFFGLFYLGWLSISVFNITVSAAVILLYRRKDNKNTEARKGDSARGRVGTQAEVE